MTRRFLLDTSAVSQHLRPEPVAGIIPWMRARKRQLAIGAPAWHELRFGFERLPPSRRRRAIESYLAEVASWLPVLAYDEAAATWHARERARLARLGKTPPFVDGQIAAVAWANDLALVTTNPTDFLEFDGLRLRAW